MTITRTARHTLTMIIATASAVIASNAGSQPPQPAPAITPFNPYPARTVDPAAVERGRTVYTVYGCAFCHGEDTRGGSGGPSLLRSQLVQRDQAGETIANVVRDGVPNTAMAGFALSPDELRDLAEFLHSFPLQSRDPARMRPESIVTGDPEEGGRYFEARCASCHSPSADLAGFAARYPDERRLQHQWLMPRDAPPTRARVTVRGADPVEGELKRIDEFIVSIALADGRQRTFARSADEPRVEILDPLEAHKALLPLYADRDIHNVTAFLATLK